MKSKLYAQYLCGIITEAQFHEVENLVGSYELQGVENNPVMRSRFENLISDKDMYSQFLTDMDGKYKKIRDSMAEAEALIEKVKKSAAMTQSVIQKMGAVRHAPTS